LRFNELVQPENQAEYLLVLVFGSLLFLLAMKAKPPWTQVGFGLLAVAIVVLVVAARVSARQRPGQNLMESCDRRIRLMRNGRFLFSLPLSAGLIAVVLGNPGYGSSVGGWSFLVSLLAAFWGGQWQLYLQARASMWKKREEAERLLRELPRD
jgi:hypothetical protein